MAANPSPTLSAPATAAEISRRVNAGELAMGAAAAFYGQRTREQAAGLNTHLHFDEGDVARQVAEQAARQKSGAALPLAGVPVLIKDNICTKGIPTTCGSKMLAGFRPPYDAHVVEALKAAGAIIFGKTNCDEFAMGSSNENSAYGPVLNPHDRTRVPGGSSGGSAAAVAADLAPVALGSDTGGSIRQPAAFCGVVGLKPTYGLVSRYGLVAYGSSLDVIGPLTRDVADAALVLDVISGHDARDSTSCAGPPTAIHARLSTDRSALRIGVVKELLGEGLDERTRTLVNVAIERYRKLGMTVQEVSLPSLPFSIATYYVLATAEASANLARYDGVKYGFRADVPGASLSEMYRKSRSAGFGREVKQRIMLGTFVLSSGYYDAFYAKANRARQRLRDEVERAFKQVDLLVSPTAPTTAFRLGEKSHDPLAMYLSDICTLLANLAGIPALSLPCGKTAAGEMPVGLQLMAPQFAEERLLKGAYWYEQSQL